MKKLLLRFVESLDQRGLLKIHPTGFDYEWVVWDFLKQEYRSEFEKGRHPVQDHYGDMKADAE